MVDQKHKTLRSFYCEDSLWEMFEVMTRDLDCSMDYLINESMRHYARSRNYSLTGMSRLAQPDPVYQQPAYQQHQERSLGHSQPDARTIPLSTFDARGGRPTNEWPNVGGGYQGGYRPAPPPRMPPPPPPAPRREAPPIPRPGMAHGRPRVQGPEPMPPSRPAPAPPVHQGYPPAPRGREYPPEPRLPAGRAPLFLFFSGQRYVVDKDRFIIGRGSQNTDLTIRDGNISRKHAAVIFHDGAYYVQDLGSTNGIEYRNAKVASKQIEEGDVFNICDYSFASHTSASPSCVVQFHQDEQSTVLERQLTVGATLG